MGNDPQLKNLHDDISALRDDIKELRSELHRALINASSLQTQVRIQWGIIAGAGLALWAWVKSKIGVP